MSQFRRVTNRLRPRGTAGTARRMPTSSSRNFTIVESCVATSARPCCCPIPAPDARKTVTSIAIAGMGPIGEFGVPELSLLARELSLVPGATGQAPPGDRDDWSRR